MPRLYKKKEIDKSVYEKAKERIRDAFLRFDKVVVSFSGGKDSTCVLNVAQEVAIEFDKLPLTVHFFDEEAIHPETIDYVRRVAQRPEIDLKWLCVPIQHRNACSTTQPWWHPWHPEEKDKWVRELPPEAITEVEGFEMGMKLPDVVPLLHRNCGMVVDLRGIRADESLRRLRTCLMNNQENWIMKYPHKIHVPSLGTTKDGEGKEKSCPWYFCASPIYDWRKEDIWLAVALNEWDYSGAYDVMEKMGIRRHDQRVCPPFGEEPLRGLWMYAQGWPDLWHKMVNRVHGANTAIRYSQTELYGFGVVDKPDDISWREHCFIKLDSYSKGDRAAIAKQIKKLIETHRRKTSRPIPDQLPDPVTGCSWEFLANIAERGDLKARRGGMMTKESFKTWAKLGISQQEALSMPEDELTRRFNSLCQK